MILATLLGASLGASLASFGGVVAIRVPRGESIVRPASACDSCRAPIRYYDNVPIVSWLLLNGRCRTCAATIPAFLVCLEVCGALAGGALAYAYARVVIA
jgi:leader peptidase (prepilin peptidase)/N-methyltransferase